MRSKDLNRRALLRQSVEYLEVDVELDKARLAGLRQQRNATMCILQKKSTEFSHWNEVQVKRIHGRFASESAQIHAKVREIERRTQMLLEYREELEELGEGD